jgi:hypothetical protein
MIQRGADMGMVKLTIDGIAVFAQKESPNFTGNRTI